MQQLWFQLSISYTLLNFFAMILLVVMLYGINDYNDFHAALTLDNVEQQVKGEMLAIAQALRDRDNVELLNKARDTISEKLSNLEHGSGTSLYRITNSCNPLVYLQITDSNHRLLLSDPSSFPEKVATRFTIPGRALTTTRPVAWLEENQSVWVDMPITNKHHEVMGYLQVLYIAEFDVLVQLRSVLSFLFYIWGKMLLLCVPIGIACGWLASRYVTRQLQKMNAVTTSWRQGDFEARIALPNDDVLIRHSQHLNDMAQDLEIYLNLKQSLAVNDERNRMARELHDTVKQKLFALGLQLATAKTKLPVMEAARTQILEAETLTREAQQDLMEIITQLHPAGTGHNLLYERIAMIAADFKRRFAVNIVLNPSPPIRCDAYAEHNVLRIVQEAFMNAVRHGKASDIVFASNIQQGITMLIIADNGSGFDTEQKTAGFGITSMRDRAQHLPQGSLTINSTLNIGTQITLAWKDPS